MIDGRLVVTSVLGLWIGTSLCLSRMRWFRRVPLIERLRRYHPGAQLDSSGGLSPETFRDVIGPLARRYGNVLARTVGLREDLPTRLARVSSPLDATSFRVRQLGWSVVGFAGAILVATAFALPPLVALLVVLGLPVLAALLLEQQLAAQSDLYKARLFGELPVVAEQLGMLLGAGYSLGAALGRLADRGNGIVATDLRRVLNRVHQGLSVDVALREWADLADVDELARLVQVLALHRTATDLGHLIAEEARSIRREAHRHLISHMEQRAQLVWIPVTVAALLPGALFLAIPFADALRLVTS